MLFTSNETNHICTALTSAQAKFKTIPKDKVVTKKGLSKTGKPFEYTYNYSAFETIVEHIREPLSSSGLSYVQSIHKDGQIGVCVTRLMHSSGQFIETSFPLIFKDDDMQQYGGVSTYGKRYALTNMLGLATDDDFDANEQRNEEFKTENRAQVAQKQAEKPRYAPPATSTPEVVEKPIIEQITELAAIKGVTNAQLKDFLSKMGKKKSTECNNEELMAVLNWIKHK